MMGCGLGYVVGLVWGVWFVCLSVFFVFFWNMKGSDGNGNRDSGFMKRFAMYTEEIRRRKRFISAACMCLDRYV